MIKKEDYDTSVYKLGRLGDTKKYAKNKKDNKN